MFIELAIKAFFYKILKKVLGRFAYAIIAKTPTGLFAVDPEDYLGVGGMLLKKGCYEEAEIEKIIKHVSSDSSVLVVGSHVGALVVAVSRHCRKVTAIEANPATFELLKINLLLNNISNCECSNIAASDRNGEISFVTSRANSGGSKRSPMKKEHRYYYDNPKTISVKAVRLDDFLKEHNFDLIIMDIEGSEYFALKGMPDILNKTKMLQVEFMPQHLKDVSGASVEEFISLISPNFTRLTVPTRQLKLNQSDFLAVLNDMYKKEQGDNLFFEK